MDPTKVEVIFKLPAPSNIKGIRSFLDHVGFYRRFIKDFSKIAKPLSNLLVKEAKFIFFAPVITAPNWTHNFELICDASDHAIEHC